MEKGSEIYFWVFPVDLQNLSIVQEGPYFCFLEKLVKESKDPEFCLSQE